MSRMCALPGWCHFSLHFVVFNWGTLSGGQPWWDTSLPQTFVFVLLLSGTVSKILTWQNTLEVMCGQLFCATYAAFLCSFQYTVVVKLHYTAKSHGCTFAKSMNLSRKRCDFSEFVKSTTCCWNFLLRGMLKWQGRLCLYRVSQMAGDRAAWSNKDICVLTRLVSFSTHQSNFHKSIIRCLTFTPKLAINVTMDNNESSDNKYISEFIIL